MNQVFLAIVPRSITREFVGNTMRVVLERFTEPAEGLRRLVDALCRQSIVQGSREIAESLAVHCDLREMDAGAVLMEQGGPDNDIVLVLTGSFSILVNGREVATRRAEQHVGEMALIDPGERRSATVIALELSVVARVTESDFAAVATSHPELWKNIACELGQRLRQRNEYVRQRNSVPRMFVGSSRESIAVAEGVQSGLAHDPLIVTIWTNRIFGPSDFAIEALERVAIESDFAVLVLGPDDKIVSRKRRRQAPRDNVVLELGLFIGCAGRQRVYLLVPEGMDIKIPTDLLGVTPVTYLSDASVDLADRLALACSQLRGAVMRLGPR